MILNQCLAIETSSRIGSIALGMGDRVLERTIATPREQTSRVLEIIDELLGLEGIAPRDLDALIFGRGPGSFTGLRIAAAVAQGLSLGSGVRILPVSSLAALAQRGFDAWRRDGALLRDAPDASAPTPAAAEHALCCVDARMGEVYRASFRLSGGLAVADSPEGIGPPAAVTAPAGAFIALGDGFAAHAAALAPVAAKALAVDAAAVPGARELLALAAADVEAGRFVPIEEAVPVYLREADAWHRS